MIALMDLPTYADRELIMAALDDGEVIPISEISDANMQRRLMGMSEAIHSQLAVAALPTRRGESYSLVVFNKDPKRNIPKGLSA